MVVFETHCLIKSNTIIFSHTNYIFQWKDRAIFMIKSKAMSRATGPSLSLFILIWMYFHCLFQNGYNIE